MFAAAHKLNEDCHCISVDEASLNQELALIPEMAPLLMERRFFALVPLFLPRETVDHIANAVRLLDTVISSPGFQADALANAPAIARQAVANKGVLFGYDFHVGADGPQLIEINTNAGGALLNTALARAQRACCPEVEAFVAPGTGPRADRAIFLSFMNEWKLERPTDTLRTIAIVDNSPSEQFLYPEFLLFQGMFRREGIDAVIVDPRELRFVDGELHAGATPIDMVYNRCTDFYFSEDASAALRAAYEARAVVVTPHPLAHALYANKNNLVTLSDAERLMTLGVSATDAHAIAAVVPRTQRVKPTDADMLWNERKNYFFKPLAGYGGKAAYRGDKVTRSVFAEILKGDYVAQRMVPPSMRKVPLGDQLVSLKVDVRAYVYNGEVQLLAARLYQGQTTNFRTMGGGFASVMTTAS